MQKRDAKFYIISLVLHVLFLAIAGSGGGDGKGKGKGDGDKDGKGRYAEKEDGKSILPKTVEVNLVEAVDPKNGEGEVKLPKKKKEEPKRSKDGYYGIGVYVDFRRDPIVEYNGQQYYGMPLGNVIYGNPAHLAGLRPGDVIFMVDGKPLGRGNDVKGPGPKDLVLGIYRDGQIYFINVRRDWIETEPGTGNPATP